MIAVIFLNMGGPDSLDAVRPFLFNLFTDRYIIELGPSWLQPVIAWWIAKRRAPKSMETYRKIGGKTPLLAISRAQAKAVEDLLRAEGMDVCCTVGMRYWHPRTPDVLEDLKERGIKRVLAFSLYPHYSRVTTGTSLDDFYRAASRLGMEFKTIDNWPDRPCYINSIAMLVKEAVSRYSLDTASPSFSLVYSAHSIPEHMIREGDPYLCNIKKTIHALEARIGIKGELCFQSRSGPVKWLEPATDDLLRELVSKGKKKILVIPISFVSDHVETLCEIDMEYREMVEESGAELMRIDSLNTRDDFINCMASMIKEKVKEAKWQR